MRRSVIVYAVVFVVAMVGAYVSWTSDPETGGGDQTVQVADIAREDVASIRYETDEATLNLEPRSDEFGRYVWVVEERKAVEDDDSSTGGSDAGDAATADAGGERGATKVADTETDTEIDAGRDTGTDVGTGDGGPAKPGRPIPDDDAESGESEEKPKRLAYKASPAIDELFESLAPLEAKRRVDIGGDDERESFGFDDPHATLEIRLKSGGTRTLTLGGYSFGRRHLYVRDEKQGGVFVVDAGFVGPLEYPDSRLREHRLLEAHERDVVEVDVESAGESVELVHRNRSDPRASYWSVGSSDAENESVSSWVGKLLGLRIDRFVDDPGDDLERVLGVRVVPAEGSPVEIDVYRGAGEGEPKWFARSNYTRSHVRLQRSRATGLIDDLDAVLDAGNQAESPADEK